MFLQPESLAEQAYEIVERMIVTLELPPGYLVTEKDLSERIGIGRTPLREALQRLSGDRLVEAVPRRGIVVTDIHASDYLSLLQTRGVLDRLVAEQAARRASPEERTELQRLAPLLLEAARSKNSDGFMKYDKAVDRILEHACRNPYAYQAVSPLHAHSRRFWSVFQHHGSLVESATFHVEIMEAVAISNSEAAGNASDRLIDYLTSFTRKALDLD